MIYHRILWFMILFEDVSFVRVSFSYNDKNVILRFYMVHFHPFGF